MFGYIYNCVYPSPPDCIVWTKEDLKNSKLYTISSIGAQRKFECITHNQQQHVVAAVNPIINNDNNTFYIMTTQDFIDALREHLEHKFIVRFNGDLILHMLL